jgi:hypothetical protein
MDQGCVVVVVAVVVVVDGGGVVVEVVDGTVDVDGGTVELVGGVVVVVGPGPLTDVPTFRQWAAPSPDHWVFLGYPSRGK